MPGSDADLRCGRFFSHSLSVQQQIADSVQFLAFRAPGTARLRQRIGRYNGTPGPKFLLNVSIFSRSRATVGP
jgi:hypothetical protein